MTTITLTRVTSRKPATLAKQYSLAADGTLNVPKPAGNMVEGEAQRITLDGVHGFAELLQSLSHDQALIYGVTAPEKTRLLSMAELEAQGRPTGAMARTKDNFSWPAGGGVLLLDYDPDNNQTALNRTQLMQVLTEVLPELSASAYVCWYSGSSLLYHGQEQLQGVRGQRVYIAVQDASDIERAGKVLYQRLWIAGHGYYRISSAGTLLPRTLIDSSVWQTNRFDFAAGAQCVAPLEQRRGAPQVQDGPLLDTAAALPDLTPAQEADYQAALAAARALAEPEQQAVRTEYIQTEAGRILARDGLPVNDENMAQAMATVTRAVEQHTLSGDFKITLDRGESVTVGEVLDSPSKYHGRLTLDPLEPEYSGHKVVGKLYLIGSRPNLHSFAHGGQTYRLIRQVRRIEHVTGMTSKTTDEALELLRNLPDIFDLGDNMALVDGGRVQLLDQHGLSYYLGNVAQFYEWRAKKDGTVYMADIDPRQQMLSQIISLRRMRRLKPLQAVITAPVILADGRVLSRAGYDEGSQLYLDMLDTPPEVPRFITDGMLEQAYQTLMEPFTDFAVATPLDRSVMLAAILTAIQRPALDTAPAFGLDAPVQGTGKTYLALCLAALATGRKCAVMPPLDHRQDEEARKRITSALAAGDLTFIWDNILGDFDSASLAAMLTSSTFSDRTLGKTEKPEYPCRMMVMLTGNNLRLANDMPRRVLKCRLDAQVANPATRKFKQQPLQTILENRQKLVQAGLTIIRAYLQSKECKAGGAVPGESTASFEQWDKMVRQPVAWLAKYQGFFDLADPAEVIKQAVAYDPELELLSHALEAIRAEFGDRWFTSKEMAGALDHNYDLRELVQDLAPGSNLTARSIGRVLSYRVDRIVSGLQLQSRMAKNLTQFRVCMVTEPEQKMVNF